MLTLEQQGLPVPIPPAARSVHLLTVNPVELLTALLVISVLMDSLLSPTNASLAMLPAKPALGLQILTVTPASLAKVLTPTEPA